MADTLPGQKSLDGIQGDAARIPRGIPVPVPKSDENEKKSDDEDEA
jgi:hypothetical protein